jgi:hypothetical protein
MSFVFSPLDETIEMKNEYINRYADKTEKDIHDTEKIIDRLLSLEAEIKYERYNIHFNNLARTRNHANNMLNKYSRDKEELLRKVMEYINNILEKNELTRKLAEESIIKLNEKYFENITLAKICAKTIQSHGVENFDLQSPVKEVYESNIKI